MELQIKTLARVSEGSKIVIKDLNVSRDLRLKLIQLGLYPGAEVEVLEKHCESITIKVKSLILTLNRDIASRIIVE